MTLNGHHHNAQYSLSAGVSVASTHAPAPSSSVSSLAMQLESTLVLTPAPAPAASSTVAQSNHAFNMTSIHDELAYGALPKFGEVPDTELNATHSFGAWW
ncbi:hypothetical protein H9P43_006745 [Blastocladiella emersonii ATCC 22665]|nr:hypothetical protein H9P43_006745 [Blastocladiella emersonii ATCC 22665]